QQRHGLHAGKRLGTARPADPRGRREQRLSVILAASAEAPSKRESFRKNLPGGGSTQRPARFAATTIATRFARSANLCRERLQNLLVDTQVGVRVQHETDLPNRGKLRRGLQHRSDRHSSRRLDRITEYAGGNRRKRDGGAALD